LIEFKKVSKYFSKSLIAVNDVSFKVQQGKILVLLGTSGSGKTTTLRMVNRLEEASSGEIFIFNENIKNINPIKLRKKIGYAVQSIGLFKYMSVKENISIVLKLSKWKKNEIDTKVDELLNLFKLDPKKYKNRYPNELSGGEKQRIGVARAIANDPPILLMDEPFGLLDPITRNQMQIELLELQSQIKKTIIFVTHDISEAIKLADQIALMNMGKIVQIGSKEDLIKNPKNEFVENFFKNKI